MMFTNNDIDSIVHMNVAKLRRIFADFRWRSAHELMNNDVNKSGMVAINVWYRLNMVTWTRTSSLIISRTSLECWKCSSIVERCEQILVEFNLFMQNLSCAANWMVTSSIVLANVKMKTNVSNWNVRIFPAIHSFIQWSTLLMTRKRKENDHSMGVWFT